MAQTVSATYGNDPENNPLDKVRFLVGDTDCTEAFLSDQEIAYLLASEGSADFAAPCAANAIAAKVARRVTQNAAGVGQNLSDLFTHFNTLAKKLLAKANASAVTVYAGGLSVSEKQLDRSDADLVQPYFERGQMTNPDATDSPPPGNLRGKD